MNMVNVLSPDLTSRTRSSVDGTSGSLTRGPLEHQQPVRREQAGRAVEHVANVSDVVRRIQQNQIEAPRDATDATARKSPLAIV